MSDSPAGERGGKPHGRLSTIFYIALFCLLLIMFGWAMVLHMINRDYAAEAGLAESENAFMARAFEEHARRVFKTADNTLVFIKSEFEQHYKVSDEMIRLAHLTKEDLSAVQIAIADANGDLIFSAVPLKGKINISDRDHFIVHKNNDQAGFFIGKPRKAQATGTFTFFLSRRLNNKDGSFAGIVSIGLDPFYFGKVYDNITLGGPRSGIIVGTDHIVRVRISRVGNIVGDDISKYSPVFREAAKSPVGHYELISDLDNKERLASYRAMPDFPLIVIVSIMKEEALANFGIRKDSYLLAVSFFTLFVICFGYFLIRADNLTRRNNAMLQSELAERRKAETALAESERRFREMTTLLPEIIFELDEKGMVTFVNDQFFKSTNFTEEQVKNGLYSLDVLVPSDREAGLRAIQSVLSGAQKLEFDFSIIGKNGPFPVAIFAGPIMNEGWVAGIRGIIVDTSRIKETEAKLVQAQKMEAVGILAGGIAHDFNNILQGISGFLSLALMSGKLDAQTEAWIRKADESASRAAELVHGLLTFSRKKELRLQTVNINKEVRDSVAILERTLPKTLRIELALSGDDLCIKGDPIQLEHILLNLASNANHATHGEGRLTIATRGVVVRNPEAGWHINPGEYVLLSVSDNGMGIEDATLKNIFDPFFTTKEVGKGTGLGLAIVHGLMKEHGGHIVCRSKIGEGTTFELYFPQSVECPVPAPEELPREPEKIKEKPTVMIVDDNSAILESVSEALEAGGFKVLLAQSGEEALEIFPRMKGDIGIVVLDLGMPGMGGLKCFEALREQEPACKVIIATGYALSSMPADKTGKPADAFLPKPYRIGTLLSEIGKVNQI